MHLLIINCSPRTKSKSNTKMIVEAFAKGYTLQGNTVEIFHLSERKSWDKIRNAFYVNKNILMAIPLYVECIPGIMIEFLESLSPKTYRQGEENTRLAFLLQGGFSEASQLRCGEKYLEMLPGYLNCDYNGTLIKGNMFAAHMLPVQAGEKLVEPFSEMGKVFARDQRFQKDKVNAFAEPEFYTKGSILFQTIISPLQKMFFNIFFKKMGCKGSLRAKPYKKYL